MNKQEIEKLQGISKRIRNLNTKIKLISLLGKAQTEFEQNKLHDCEKTCKDILSQDAKNSTALRGLGCVFQARGEVNKALDYYNKALKNSKNREIELTLIGIIYYHKDNLEEAIKYFNLAIEFNDNYDLAYEGRNQAILENHLQILDLQDSLIKRNLFK